MKARTSRRVSAIVGALFALALTVGPIALLARCSPAPAPAAHQPDTKSTAADCKAACASLAAIPCDEGLKPNCVATCQAAEGAITLLPLACWSTAKTRLEARACGQIRCDGP